MVMAPVADVLDTDEWVLHAADQDLPCLAELGIRPPQLFDTELAGRLTGYDKVNLAEKLALLDAPTPKRDAFVQTLSRGMRARLSGTPVWLL